MLKSFGRNLDRSKSTASILRALLASAVFVVAANALPAYPSPADWRDETIYQVITDRFFDGDPSNNNLESAYAASNGTGVHGGDWAGLRQKLDYMQSLGVTSVWISPVVLNKSGAYHGYGAQDFGAYSPQFGNLAQLRAFSDAAHARGMRVIIDIVCNHTADFIYSTDSGWDGFRNPGTYNLRFRSATSKQASPFDNLSWYHNNGGIDQWIDPNQMLGELSGLDDLRTEFPAVQDALTTVYENMIAATDCDGFRIDTVKHVDHGFWQTWCPRIRDYCASIGKTNFLMFGEVYDGSDAKCGSYTGTMNGGAYEMNSVLHYPMYFTTNNVFVWGSATNSVSGSYAQLSSYDASARNQLVTFLDNHDQPRFLSKSMADGDTARLKPALAFQLLSVGVPCVYYGTEQAFDGNRAGSQSNDPYDREDMFAGSFEFGASKGDNFNEAHPLFLWTQRLLDLRRNHDLFRRGTQKERWNNSAGAGIYAFSRILGSDEAIVVVNTSADMQGPVTMNSGLLPGTVLIDALTSTTYTTVALAGKVTVSIAGRGALVLIPQNLLRLPDPAVDQVTPAHDATGVDGFSEIQLDFNTPMDVSSVTAAFSISPAVPVTFRSISSTTFRVRPNTPLPANTLFQVRVTTGARERDIVTGSGQRTLRAAFESRFKTGNSLQIPAGYNAVVLADGSRGLSAPEGLDWSPGGAWGSFLYVGDEGTHGFFKISADGATVTPFTASHVFTKPEGMEFDPPGGLYGGRLVVGDSTGVYAIAADGTATAINASISAVTGAAAIDHSGLFRRHFYLGSNQTDNIIELNPDGSNSTFQSGLAGFEALTFGPGNAFGTDMYAADPDLSSVLASINGSGAVYRIQPNGTRTMFAQNVALARGIAGLAIDPVGRFNGDMFGADVLAEKIVRITSAGVMSDFATGFGNLFGSHCIAFDLSGAMYVADTGSGQPFTDSSGGTAPPRIYRITSPSTSAIGDWQMY